MAASWGPWYTAAQMQAYADARCEEARVVEREKAEQWRQLYRRAVNEANGLTNYVEDRPELRRSERNLAAIEAEARAIEAAIRNGA